MRRIARETIVAAPAELVFDTVADVEQYPRFLSDVRRVRRDGDHVEMTIQAGPIEVTFTSRATFHRPHLIDLHLVKGPFRTLHARWSFHPTQDGRTRVRYEATFELALRVPGADRIVGTAMEANAGRTVLAFRERVEALARSGSEATAPPGA